MGHDSKNWGVNPDLTYTYIFLNAKHTAELCVFNYNLLFLVLCRHLLKCMCFNSDPIRLLEQHLFILVGEW